MRNLKLAILGAGCSYGMYPLADDMLGDLRAFAEKLGQSAMDVKNCVMRTLGLMSACKGVRTLDQLVERIHEGCLDDASGNVEEKYAARYLRLAEAKLALTALFLGREFTALHTGLPRYVEFIEDVLLPSALRDHCLDRLEKTPWRVLSFNYDRLFEAAFLGRYMVDDSLDLYGPQLLNSGIQKGKREITFAEERFSFLKLHGSVGMVADNSNGLLWHGYTLPSQSEPFPIRDDVFFTISREGQSKPKPTLIVFPHEKEYLFNSDTAFPYQAYAREVWRRAQALAEQAEEIWLIGYSAGRKDMPYLAERVLLAAKNCTRIVVQNPTANVVAEDLATRIPDIAGRVKPFNRDF